MNLRRIALLVGCGAIAWALFGVPTARADCGDPFARPDEVLDFHFRVSTAEWAQLQSSGPSQEGCDGQYPYVPAEFRCGDSEPFLAVSIRRKRDRSETRSKLPLKLDFNRTVPGQRWPASLGELGYRKLTLNSGQADDAGRTSLTQPANPGTLSALLTEHFAWRLMRQELPEASGVAFARVTLHFTDTGATHYQGLYILIEDIDRTTVRARFGKDQGSLLKTTDLNCVDELVFEDGPPNDAGDGVAAWLAQQPGDFAGGWYARTNQAMHLDPLLRQEALRELLANGADTVLGNRNNYFALDLRGDRRWFLPWDLDDMFRPFPQVRAPDMPLSRCGTGGRCASNRFATAIREQPEIRARYLEVMCQIAGGVAHEQKLLSELQALDALVRPIVATEVASIWAPLGRDPLDQMTAGTYAAEVERMKAWIPARIQAVRSLIEAEGGACSADCPEGETSPCEYLGRPSRRTCSAGRWSTCERVAVSGGTGGGGGTPAGGAGGATTGAGGVGGHDGAAAGATGSGGMEMGAGGLGGSDAPDAGVNGPPAVMPARRSGCSLAGSVPASQAAPLLLAALRWLLLRRRGL